MITVRRYLWLVTPVLFAASFAYLRSARAQTAAPPPSTMKHILVVGETKGFEHDSVSNAMGTIWKLGHDSRLWDAYLRTDCELITSKDIGRNAKNLSFFDAIVFASTTGELAMDDDQKKDMMSFIHDQGKGFVGVHAALDTNYQWPEYGEMIGGWFDQHPWGTFDAPIVLEAPDFPATKQFSKAFVKRDEIYQPKAWSRDKVNVLLRLDATKLNYKDKDGSDNPRIHRADRDFPVAWSKMYGQGRVFYSTLGHTKEAWDDPQITQMYFEAIKWTLRLTQGSTTSHAIPTE